ncbi:MAG: TonB-dependent receptor, partial [Cytophagaceae bacterium]
MRNLYCLFFFVFSSCLGQLSYGQTRNSAISGNFNGLSFTQFAEAIEARTDYRFYFKPADVDSLQVQLQVTDKPLVFLLTRVFEGTQLHFAIDARSRVFITPNQPIRTSLPVGFFDR